MGVDGVGPGGPDLHGFSLALTSFVGRADAVAEVAGLLASSRLVTVTGPGGVGKTRLSAEVARRVAARFADGVWLVELAAVTDPARVPPALAAALGVREIPATPAMESLVRVLARQQLLIVLDNCEQVITAVAHLCAGLLPAADDVRILATSREPVGVAGETRYRLPPLALPDPGEEAAASDAVALFADRARQADPHFRLDQASSSLVTRLVQRLDGLPLAIELAAARVESLGVAQLLDRLDERSGLLAGTDRLAAARHQSLAATVDWSYHLLSEREQRVFRQISVFPGPFTLDAAETVAGADAGPVVLRLVDCSLVTPPRADPDGRARYLMLDTLRSDGARRAAEAGEQRGDAAALARYAVGVAEQAAAGMHTSTGEQAAASWLDAEGGTVHTALAWALEHDPSIALRLVIALAPWWQVRGQLAAGAAPLRTAAAFSAPGSEPWCAVQSWLGQACHSAGDFPGAVAACTLVADALAGAEPSPVLVDALASRSASLVNVNRIPEGMTDAHRALTLARTLGYRGGEALALSNLHLAAYYAGDLAQALAWAQQAQQIDPAVMSGWVARRCHNFLTVALLETGDVAAAMGSCATALARPGRRATCPARSARRLRHDGRNRRHGRRRQHASVHGFPRGSEAARRRHRADRPGHAGRRDRPVRRPAGRAVPQRRREGLLPDGGPGRGRGPQAPRGDRRLLRPGAPGRRGAVTPVRPGPGRAGARWAIR